MNKQNIIPVLAGLLLVQLVLAAGLQMGGDNFSGSEPAETLLTFNRDNIDQVKIADAESAVTLKKVNDQWQVSEANFTADSSQVGKLLDNLAGLKQGWPIATTGEAAKRFNVTDESFERKITLLQGDKVVDELIMGSSPSYKKVHARLAGEDDIYTVGFSTYEASARADHWIDKSVLQQDVAGIETLKLPSLTLSRQEDGMLVDNLNADEETNSEEAKALLDKVAAIKIQSVLGEEAKPEYGLDKSPQTLELTLKGGKQITYTMAQADDKSYYVLKSSEMPQYFKVANYVLNPILEIERNKLVQARSEEDAEQAETTPVAANENKDGSGS